MSNPSRGQPAGSYAARQRAVEQQQQAVTNAQKSMQHNRTQPEPVTEEAPPDQDDAQDEPEEKTAE